MYITVSPTAVTSCGSDTGSVTVDAGFFEPGSTVTITLQSDPVVLGTLVASATGTVNATYTLPVGVTAGSHTVFATGPRQDGGQTETLQAVITVTIPQSCVSSGAQTNNPTPSSSSGALPTTGSNTGIFLAVGAGLLVAGGLTVMATRRNAAHG